MRAAPGSLAWLLGRQVAWQWRGVTAGARRGLGVLAALVLLGTLGGFFALRGISASLPTGGPLPDAALVPLSAALLFLFTVMVSAAISASIETLYTRGDLDLLLHSPLSPRVVLASRALGVALSTALAVALLVVPLVLIALALGVWRGLGLLVWWAGAALLAGCLGLGLTLGLVRLLGVRRARTVASVLGALTGAAVFLLFQWNNIRGQDSSSLVTRLPELVPGVGPFPAADSPVWYGVRAAWLEPGPALALTALAGLALALTVLALTRSFTQGAQEVTEKHVTRRARGAERPLRFASGRRATLLKEWRLIGRDPELLSRTLLQLVYLLPLLFPLSRAGGVRGAAGVGVVLVCGSLTSALAHLTLNAEDAPDLLRSAPRPAGALRGEKVWAAVLPVLALGGAGLLWLASRGVLVPGAALVLLALLGLGAVGSAWLVLWQPLPVRRADAFRNTARPNLVTTVLQLVFQIGLAATGYAATAGALWGLATLAAALAALGVAYALRRPDPE